MGQPSPNHLALSDALARVRVPVSPKQLERLRQSGLLGDLRSRGLGRGRGSASGYSVELVERVIEAVALRDRYRRLDPALLVSFVRGVYPVQLEKLVAAYGREFERREERFDPATDGDELGFKLARRASKDREQRGLRRRLKDARKDRRFETVEGMLEEFYVDFLPLLHTGGSSGGGAPRLVLSGLGLTALVSEHAPGHAPPIPTLPIAALKDALAASTLGALTRALGTASEESLKLAREDTLALVGFARAFTPFAQKAYGLREAFGFAALADLSELGTALAIPAALVLRSRFPTEMDELRGFLDVQTPRFVALSALVNLMPARCNQHLLAVQGGDDLSPNEERELREVVGRFEQAEPEKYALLMAWEDD